MVIERGKRYAAQELETAAADIEFARDGDVPRVGTDRRIGLLELAAKARTMTPPEGVEPGLTPRRWPRSTPGPSPTAATSPRSRSIPTPGSRAIVRYTVVDDFGVVLNPMLVAGQVHGGVVQGIGQALLRACGLRRQPASS